MLGAFVGLLCGKPIAPAGCERRGERGGASATDAAVTADFWALNASICASSARRSLARIISRFWSSTALHRSARLMRAQLARQRVPASSCGRMPRATRVKRVSCAAGGPAARGLHASVKAHQLAPKPPWASLQSAISSVGTPALRDRDRLHRRGFSAWRGPWRGGAAPAYASGALGRPLLRLGPFPLGSPLVLPASLGRLHAGERGSLPGTRLRARLASTCTAPAGWNPCGLPGVRAGASHTRRCRLNGRHGEDREEALRAEARSRGGAGGGPGPGALPLSHITEMRLLRLSCPHT